MYMTYFDFLRLPSLFLVMRRVERMVIVMKQYERTFSIYGTLSATSESGGKNFSTFFPTTICNEAGSLLGLATAVEMKIHAIAPIL
jgi:hypothetical protein